MSPRAVDRHEVRALLAQGAQLAEVLDKEEYDDEHLIDAVHLPLKALTAAGVEASGLDRAKPVIAYCWDGL